MIVTELLSGIAAKLAAAGLAKVGAGLTVAALSVTGAGAAANVLPEPAQNGVANAIEAVSPLDIPGGKAEDKKKDVAESEENENNNFGERVSNDAKDGGVEGKTISDEARQRAEQRRAANAGTTGRSTADAHKPSTTGSADTADEVRPEQSEDPSSVADDFKPVETPAGSPDTADDHKPSQVPPAGRR